MHRIVVFSEGGKILWSKETEGGESIPNSVINTLVAREFIEGSKVSTIDGYTVKVARDHELGIATALIHPSIIKVAHADSICKDLTKVFVSVNEDSLRGNPGTLAPADLDHDKFSALARVRLLDIVNESTPVPEKEAEHQALEEPETPEPPAQTKQTAAAKAAEVAKKMQKKKKQQRKWDGSEDHDGPLDYSEPAAKSSSSVYQEEVDLDYGTQSKDGFVVKELTNELNNILREDKSKKNDQAGSFSFLRNIVGGKKLSEKDLDKAIAAMEDHLVNKNVAKEVATLVCAEIRKDLVGTTTDSWTSVNATVRKSVARTLQKILTPTTSVDMLLQVKRSKRQGGRPYVISVVGVNGVGKSTNLGKIAFWLLQNKMKVLVAACDTFRSGAVEQLKVHVDRLRQLTERQNAGEVELFSQGYGKDAAVIAQKAVEYGQSHGFDVVLIDTAGRRHNDERLMSSLEKFGKLANPDKIIMVGEALVGTDSVAQAKNFDSAFGPQRHIDFFLISKCDTVGDMLGTLVNMTYTTGIPVLFVGVGQNYTDLRTLSVDWAVNLLLE